VQVVNITCIGGGHGLARLLKSLSKRQGFKLNAIVCTSDNGGSTGRLRQAGTEIGWGDVRHCMSQLSEPTSAGHVLLNHRFEARNELDDHALGNLILDALSNYTVRATDAVAVLTRMLDIQANILPMSDDSCDLEVMTTAGEHMIGELEIAQTEKRLNYNTLGLTNNPKPTAEVLKTIAQSDLILLAPGSFVTSILPALLMQDVIEGINSVDCPFVMLANLEDEPGDQFHYLQNKLLFLQSLGLRSLHQVCWPEHRELEGESIDELKSYPLTADEGAQHNISELLACVETVIGQQNSQLAF